MRLLAAVPLLLAACATVPARTASGPGAAPPSVRDAEVLPFIDDDYGRALAEARRHRRAIFVDAWAPW